MDDIVEQSLKKWPNVPHCYGWLALDARGHWRMRDQHAQDHDLPGDRIAHTALIAFIDRNYDCDAAGRWFFQNGPQRVYVNLGIAPYIARTDPIQGLLLHTGAPLPAVDAIYLTPAGRLIFQFTNVEGKPVAAALDDRDLAQCVPALHRDGEPVNDAALLDWLDGGSGELTWHYVGAGISRPPVTVQRIAEGDIARTCHFVLTPQPDSGELQA